LLQQTGVTDQSVLRGVKEDKEKQKFHLACNRYTLNPFVFSAWTISLSSPAVWTRNMK
jgi:hypothetical protein